MLSDVARAVRAVASYLLGLLRPGSKTSLVRSDVVSAAGEYLLLPGHRIRVANLATMFFLFFGGGFTSLDLDNTLLELGMDACIHWKL